MKRRMILFIVIIYFVETAGIVLSECGRKPFWNLNADDISTASVRLIPPDQAVPINDIMKLVNYLKNVVIYNKDNSYTEYDGQGVIFTLTMTDGTQ